MVGKGGTIFHTHHVLWAGVDGMERGMSGQDALTPPPQKTSCQVVASVGECSQDEYKWENVSSRSASSSTKNLDGFASPRQGAESTGRKKEHSGTAQCSTKLRSSTALDNCRPRQGFNKRPQSLPTTEVIICRLSMTSYEAELANVHEAGSGELTSTADTVITQPAKRNEE